MSDKELNLRELSLEFLSATEGNCSLIFSKLGKEIFIKKINKISLDFNKKTIFIGEEKKICEYVIEYDITIADHSRKDLLPLLDEFKSGIAFQILSCTFRVNEIMAIASLTTTLTALSNDNDSFKSSDLCYKNILKINLMNEGLTPHSKGISFNRWDLLDFKV